MPASRPSRTELRRVPAPIRSRHSPILPGAKAGKRRAIGPGPKQLVGPAQTPAPARPYRGSRCRRSNGKKTRPVALPASDASWIMLNDVMPSGPTPHSSPSRQAWRAPSDDTAAAICGYLCVQSSPVQSRGLGRFGIDAEDNHRPGCIAIAPGGRILVFSMDCAVDRVKMHAGDRPDTGAFSPVR